MKTVWNFGWWVADVSPMKCLYHRGEVAVFVVHWKNAFCPLHSDEKVIFCYHIKQNSDITGLSFRGRDRGLPSSYYERGRWLVAQENRRKIEPKEIPSCLISCLLVVFIRQLEILVTSLDINNFIYLTTIIKQLLRLTFFSEDYFNSKNLNC